MNSRVFPASSKRLRTASPRPNALITLQSIAPPLPLPPEPAARAGATIILVTNALLPYVAAARLVSWKGARIGKSVEPVMPAT